MAALKTPPYIHGGTEVSEFTHGETESTEAKRRRQSIIGIEGSLGLGSRPVVGTAGE
jgi:hypothetical protein